MNGHRERLMALGLYEPFSLDTECKRNGILKRLAEGESFSMEPIWCVFRKDVWDRHILYEGEFAEYCCQDAELIAEKLTSYEARNLCATLNSMDPDQPKGGPPCHFPLGMYGYATMEAWGRWSQEHTQMSLF